MSTAILHDADFLPTEYKESALNLFREGAGLDAIKKYAQLLGVESAYERNFSSDTEFQGLLQHFHKNSSLLIAKTWVDKADKIRKEKIGARIQTFVTKAGAGNYDNALADFGIILEEFGFLFFGEQSKKTDLLEYAFRIDIQLGLFCWYGKHLADISPQANFEFRRALLLMGICYLTSL
ncbi:MAG: hypothetical protein LBD22_03620 [Spirochaetaceae bacterium]|jgi:hypothetical protein|nr:hypothetical protein [Spirochaetaceae bacterium]